MVTGSSAGRVITGDPQISAKRTFIVEGEPGVEIALHRIAHNTQTEQFLFVWEEGAGHVFKGKILNKKARPIGGELELGASNGFFNVAYNPQSNEYLLVYDNLFGSDLSSIFVQRLTNSGNLIGNTVELTKDSVSTTANLSPQVTFNPITGGYHPEVVLRPHHRGSKQAYKGAPDGPVVMIHKTSTGLFFPPFDLAYLPSEKKLMVVYFVGILGIDGGDIYLGRLDPLLKKVKKSNLKKLNTALVVRENGVFWGANIAFLPDLTGVVFYVR